MYRFRLFFGPLFILGFIGSIVQSIEDSGTIRDFFSKDVAYSLCVGAVMGLWGYFLLKNYKKAKAKHIANKEARRLERERKRAIARASSGSGAGVFSALGSMALKAVLNTGAELVGQRTWDSPNGSGSIFGTSSNTTAPTKNKCKYCGAEAYGKGCIHGPNGYHVHFPTGDRCIYCGSRTVSGKGCIYSPNGYHQTA